MTKDLIIIALIVLVIYLYYQQNNLDNHQPLAQLQTELNHYQTINFNGFYSLLQQITKKESKG